MYNLSDSWRNKLQKFKLNTRLFYLFPRSIMFLRTESFTGPVFFSWADSWFVIGGLTGRMQPSASDCLTCFTARQSLWFGWFIGLLDDCGCVR